MSHFNPEEKAIIDHAIKILGNKLKTKNIQLNNTFLVKNYLRLQLEKCQREHMSAFYLDTQLRLIEYKVVFSGLINSCPISPREFVKDALHLNATGVIIAHNHPSGDATPSTADVKVTHKIKKAFDLFQIELIDHFVVGHKQIKSLRELNLI